MFIVKSATVYIHSSHTAFSYFPMLWQPIWVLASSNVSSGVPSKMECSKWSRGPTPASSKPKTEDSNFNKLCIHVAHSQTHHTFPTAWLSNLMSSWKSPQPRVTTTRPGFLSSIFCFIKASTTSHPQGASHSPCFSELPTFTEFKSTQATNILQPKYRAQQTHTMLASFPGSSVCDSYFFSDLTASTSNIIKTELQCFYDKLYLHIFGCPVGMLPS